jgi:hypothetical protein
MSQNYEVINKLIFVMVMHLVGTEFSGCHDVSLPVASFNQA